MKHIGLRILFATAVFIFILSLILFISSEHISLSHIIKLNPFHNKIGQITPVKIVDNTREQTYILNEDVYKLPEIANIIAGTDVVKFPITLTITNDNTYLTSVFATEVDETVVPLGGFYYSIDYQNKTIDLRVYLTDEIEDKARLLFINRGFIAALLSAAESNYGHYNPEYSPNFSNAKELAKNIAYEMYNSNNYYINYEIYSQ